jgi:hypothetical protein
VNFNSEITDSGPHLSAAAAWPPRATLTPWLKAAVGTARRVSRQRPASPAPARQRRLGALARRLTDRAAIPTASPTPPQSRPELAHRRRAAVRRSRAGEPLLLSHFLCTDAVSSPARRAAPPRVAPPCAVCHARGRGLCPHCASGPSGFGPVAPG